MSETKELLHEAIENMDEEDIEEVFKFIDSLSKKTVSERKRSLFSKLREIRIDGPSDLAENSNDYVLGKKNV